MAKMEAKLIDAQNDFGMSVLKTLAKESSENSLVVSPFSLLNALAIANVGSKGKTAEELASIFGTSLFSTFLFRTKLLQNRRRMEYGVGTWDSGGIVVSRSIRYRFFGTFSCGPLNVAHSIRRLF